MSETMSTALMVMVVGMGTVFLILYLITQIGKAIILLSNKYFPGEEEHVSGKKSAHSKNTHAAIEAAIGIVTSGKGKVTEIKKI